MARAALLAVSRVDLAVAVSRVAAAATLAVAAWCVRRRLRRQQAVDDMDDVVDLRLGHPSKHLLPQRAIREACLTAAHHLNSGEFDLQYGEARGSLRFRSLLAAFLCRQYNEIVPEDGLLVTNGGNVLHILPNSCQALRCCLLRLMCATGCCSSLGWSVSAGLDLVAGVLAKPGDVVLMVEPTYYLAHNIFLERGLHVVGVSSDGLGINLAELQARLDSLGPDRVRFLYVVLAHDNPTGRSMTTERMRELLAIAITYDFVIVADDVYLLLDWSPEGSRPQRLAAMDPPLRRRIAAMQVGDGSSAVQSSLSVAISSPIAAVRPRRSRHSVSLARLRTLRSKGLKGSALSGDGSTFSLLEHCAKAAEGHVISLGSFTKILAPALRLGWAEAAPALIARLSQSAVMKSGGGSSAFTSELVGNLLEDGTQAAHLSSLICELRTACDVLCNALDESGLFRFERPTGGYFVWVRLPDRCPPASLLLPIAEANGVRFLPGIKCAPGPNETEFDRHVRLCFAHEPTEKIRLGVARLTRAVIEAMEA